MTEDIDDLPSEASAVVVIERNEIPNTNVWVKQEHNIDSMGPFSDGTYVFYYEYDMYYFSSEAYATDARSYVDTPEEASFTGIEVYGEHRFLEVIDFQLPIMNIAIEYLQSKGKTKLEWLDTNNHGGYSAIPVTK